MSSILDVGELAALATAISWTGSSLAFAVSSRRVGGLAVNQFRLLLALPVMFALAVAASGEPWPLGIPTDRLLRLVLSGVVGLVLGDAGYFYALTWLGPRLSSVLMATWPAMAVALALLLDGEAPTAAALLGVAVTMAGVVLVLLRGDGGWNPAATPRQRLLAILGALAGALGQAGAVALSRPAMQAAADLPAGVPPLVATLIRLAAAAPAIVVLSALRGEVLVGLRVCRDRRALRVAVLGTTFGPVVGVWLSMTAVRYAAQAGVAAALMATTPLFMMLVSRVVYGVRIGWRGVVGTVLAVVGAAVLLAAA